MNTAAKTNKGTAKKTVAGFSTNEELKTESPISEKDEVKKAEEQLKKQQKANSFVLNLKVIV